MLQGMGDDVREREVNEPGQPNAATLELCFWPGIGSTTTTPIGRPNAQFSARRSVKITDEMLTDQPDVMGQIQSHLTFGVIQSERAKLAAVSSWQLAWETYLPTPLDKPEDYAPYLVRLTDLT